MFDTEPQPINWMFPMSMSIRCISPPCKRLEQSNGNLVGGNSAKIIYDRRWTRKDRTTLDLPTFAYNTSKIQVHLTVHFCDSRNTDACHFKRQDSASSSALPKSVEPNLPVSVIWWEKGGQHVPVSTKYSSSGKPYSDGRTASNAT